MQVARHQPLHLGPRAALPPAVLWFHWRSWAFKTYGRTARLVVLSTKFPFPPAGGASIAPSPSGCPFILGALSSWFHWRFLVPFQNRVREVRDLDPPIHLALHADKFPLLRKSVLGVNPPARGACPPSRVSPNCCSAARPMLAGTARRSRGEASCPDGRYLFVRHPTRHEGDVGRPRLEGFTTNLCNARCDFSSGCFLRTRLTPTLHC